MKPPQSHMPFLVLAISVTFFVGALYAYLYWQVSVSMGKAVAARDLAQTERLRKDRQKDMQKLYESTAAERSNLSGYFIASDQTVQFIEAVESIGPISGAEVTLSAINADNLEKEKPGTRGTVRANVDALGSWVAVYKTLLFAERLPYKVSIDKIKLVSVGSAGGAKGSKTWKISFEIVGSLIVTAPPKTT